MTASVCLALALSTGCGSSTGSPERSTAAAQALGARSSGLQAQKTPDYAAAPSATAVQGGVVLIAYRSYAIDPDTVKVRLGSTIRWQNYDRAPHNVTSTSGPQPFASANLAQGATFEVKLTNPGVIHYESTTQPATMNGTIEVVK